MLEWIKLTKRAYNKYTDVPVFAISKDGTILNGYLFQSMSGGVNCENDSVYISNVTHIIPEETVVAELRKTLPTKKEE